MRLILFLMLSVFLIILVFNSWSSFPTPIKNILLWIGGIIYLLCFMPFLGFLFSLPGIMQRHIRGVRRVSTGNYYSSGWDKYQKVLWLIQCKKINLPNHLSVKFWQTNGYGADYELVFAGFNGEASQEIWDELCERFPVDDIEFCFVSKLEKFAQLYQEDISDEKLSSITYLPIELVRDMRSKICPNQSQD
jgi:hypothetical protein